MIVIDVVPVYVKSLGLFSSCQYAYTVVFCDGTVEIELERFTSLNQPPKVNPVLVVIPGIVSSYLRVISGTGSPPFDT